MTKNVLLLVTCLAAGLTAAPLSAQSETPEPAEEAVEVAPAPLVIPPPMIMLDVPRPPMRTVPDPRPAPPPPPPPIAQIPATDLPKGDLKSDPKSGAKLEWQQSPVMFIPSSVKAGDGKIFENTTIITAPLVWASSARLGADVAIVGAGETVALKAGDILPRVVLRTATGIDQRVSLFCTRSRLGQQTANPSLFGKLLDGITQSLSDAQRCLQDTDGDGKLDLAVILGEGSDIIKGDDIDPVPFESLFAEPIPGNEDFLTIQMTGVGRKNVQFFLDIKLLGKSMQFDTLTSGFRRANKFTSVSYEEGKPSSASILGVRITITDAVRKENHATLEWAPLNNNPFDFVIIPTQLYRSYY